MKILRLFLVVAFLAGAQEPLTNVSIVKMVKAGLGEGLIITMVQNQPGRYSLTPDDLVKLKQEGVPEKILTAMVAKGSRGGLPAAPPVAPAGASTAQNNTFFVVWRDPQENAFQVGCRRDGRSTEDSRAPPRLSRTRSYGPSRPMERFRSSSTIPISIRARSPTR
jgi:hypothetical protein